jgi:hypothetical protein
MNMLARPGQDDLTALRRWLAGPFELQRPAGISFPKFIDAFKGVGALVGGELPADFFDHH